MPDDCPDFRATVHRGHVHLVDWGPWLADSGPMGMLLARLRNGVAIADLSVLRDGDNAAEVMVNFAHGDTPLARSTLLHWAASVGYRRVWLPDAVVDLDVIAGGTATTRCTSCRARWEDSDTEFWLSVRRTGRFPTVCPICGSGLPQWTPEGSLECM